MLHVTQCVINHNQASSVWLSNGYEPTKMAGALKKDPAIERFAAMRAGTQEHFRVNRRSGPFLLLVVGLIPLGLGYLSYHTHGQVQLAGLRRGEPFMRQFPAKKTETSEE